MARRWPLILASLLLLAGVAFALLTMPRRLPARDIAPLASADAARGERIFRAGGCTSCHAAKGAKGADRLKLGGGAPLVTKFGTFHAPNISPHLQDGIGGWNLADFANAMQRGVSPDGHFYYPAFPYTSYARMRPGDVADLYAYLRTLPPVSGEAPANDIGFPVQHPARHWTVAAVVPRCRARGDAACCRHRRSPCRAISRRRPRPLR